MGRAGASDYCGTTKRRNAHHSTLPGRLARGTRGSARKPDQSADAQELRLEAIRGEAGVPRVPDSDAAVKTAQPSQNGEKFCSR